MPSPVFPFPVAYRTSIDEDALWLRHSPGIFRADRFVGTPCFYPVYRYRNFYSYSVLKLLQLKGHLSPDPVVSKLADSPKFLYYSGARTIDRSIRRIGGPLHQRRAQRCGEEEIGSRVAAAMVQHAADVEEANPNYTNIILAGGKDSLNLLLLPWKNPVLVASAAPNYPLVREFLAANALPFECIELTDHATEEDLEAEVAATGCLLELQNVRWSSHLKRLGAERNQRVVFWQGSIADVMLTAKGRTYARQFGAPRTRLGALLAACEKRWHASEYRLAKRLCCAMWQRAAMWQGASHAVFRDVSGCLVASGYHGKAMHSLWQQLSFSQLTERDWRSEVGDALHGRPVRYPQANPSPAPSRVREQLVTSQNFVRCLQKTQSISSERGVPTGPSESVQS